MNPDEPVGLPEEERPRLARERMAGGLFRGRARWVALGVLLALSVGFAGAVFLTQSDRGRSQVLAFTLRALGGRLNGNLQVERIAGNLLTGAWVYGLSLTDPDGEPLALVDSAYIRYRVPTLLGGDIVIPRVDVYDATISIFRMPGDTIWNYQRVLADPMPSPTPGPPGATLIESLTLHDSRVEIRSPFGTDPRLTPDEQQLAIEEALADTARWMVEAVPGGYLRTMYVNVAMADLAELFISPDERSGTYLEVNDAVADIYLWRDPPLQVRQAEARLHLREGIVNLESRSFALPDSRGEMVGRIDLRGDRPMYDVVLTMEAFALADLRWLYPWLPPDPNEGRGSGRIWVEDQPDELLVYARDLLLELPGTRVTGRGGILTGDPPRFVDLALEADPLDVESLERLLPEELPVDELEIGRAVIRGD